jgi:hypothetical protein
MVSVERLYSNRIWCVWMLAVHGKTTWTDHHGNDLLYFFETMDDNPLLFLYRLLYSSRIGCGSELALYSWLGWRHLSYTYSACHGYCGLGQETRVNRNNSLAASLHDGFFFRHESHFLISNAHADSEKIVAMFQQERMIAMT